MRANRRNRNIRQLTLRPGSCLPEWLEPPSAVQARERKGRAMPRATPRWASLIAAAALSLTMLISPARADFPRDWNDCPPDVRAALDAAEASLRQAQCDADDARRQLNAALSARGSADTRVRWAVDRLNALNGQQSQLTCALNDAARDADNASAAEAAAREAV